MDAVTQIEQYVRLLFALAEIPAGETVQALSAFFRATGSDSRPAGTESGDVWIDALAEIDGWG